MQVRISEDGRISSQIGFCLRLLDTLDIQNQVPLFSRAGLASLPVRKGCVCVCVHTGELGGGCGLGFVL